MASDYKYLVVTANKVFLLLNRSPTPTPSELTESANLCCNTLRRLSNDKLFFRDVETLSERQRSNPVAFRQITGADSDSLDHFEFFWKHEKTLLVSAGMDENLVEQISSAVRNIIQGIREERLSVVSLRNLIAKIRDRTCKITNALNKVQELQEEEERRERERNIRRALYAIAGAAIVAIDASSLVATIGLTAPGTAVSGAVGGALIGVAVPPP